MNVKHVHIIAEKSWIYCIDCSFLLTLKKWRSLFFLCCSQVADGRKPEDHCFKRHILCLAGEVLVTITLE